MFPASLSSLWVRSSEKTTKIYARQDSPSLLSLSMMSLLVVLLAFRP
uniref:Uncharacterized protein n=1 Tax=Arundo donax TaxID=35708 RepID=A0A0A8ZVT7_ARUDO